MRLTERAAEHVRKFLDAQEDVEALRVSIKTTGCSGYSYVVDTADNVNDGDEIFESQGVKIVVDQSSIEFLKGTEMDYVKDGLKEGFQFNNPNVAETCGCGESFTVE